MYAFDTTPVATRMIYTAQPARATMEMMIPAKARGLFSFFLERETKPNIKPRIEQTEPQQKSDTILNTKDAIAKPFELSFSTGVV